MKKIILLILGMFSILYAHAQTGLPLPYVITAGTTLNNLPGSCWQMMADATGKMSFEQVQNAIPFQNTNRKINYRSHVYWVRFRLINAMQKEADIAMPESAAQVGIYTKINNGKWTHSVTGTMVKWSRRDGLKRIPAFTVTIPAGDTLTVYKRIYWDYVAAQPDSMSVPLIPTEKLIQQNYIHNDSIFMTSLQGAFILGLFVLSAIISFYFFLVVREKEFLYFSLYLLIASLYSIPTLHDIFFREHPYFLLYLYIFSNSLLAFGLIHSLRQFLKTFKWFPRWDKILVVFSFLLVAGLLSSYFASAIFHTDLSASSHLVYNLLMVISAVIVLITLFLFIRHRDKAIRLMIIAFTPILCLKLISYLVAVIYGLYYPRLGEPAVSSHVTFFSKVAFFIMIVTYLWMIGLFNWVMFWRFSNIRKGYMQQQELDRLKSRFFANISHEFRTPLTLIIGPLEDMMHGGNPEKLTALVPEMHRNSKRLLQLINQLLDLSRLDSGNYHINTTREDIIPFVRQIVHSFSSLAERKNINLELEVDPDLSIAFDIENTFFYFDEDIIEKVLTNLLSNAFKFTPDNGEILISLSLTDGQQSCLEMKVEDNGEGIPSEKLPYIFDRFYQADHSIRRPYEGSGIGLSLVKELITLHHGKITVTSQLHKGTVFTCLFPLNEKIATQSGKTKKSVPAIPEISLMETENDHDENELIPQADDKPLILVVEDHRDVRKYIVEKLQDDHAMLEAENGKEGLEMALEKIPDLVVSDVMMPEIDGYALCKTLKTDDRTCHIPVILLTARAEDSDKMAGLETGADAYLIKPFNAQELRIRVGKLIEVRNKMRAKFSDKLIVKPSEITVTSIDQQFMQKLLAAVEDHISDPQFSVDQLAGQMNMSTSQIYRKLKALIDQSAQQFIQSIRMQRALELLKNGSGTVSEISWKVGFENPGYFSKVFKNHFGCLPSEKEKFPV